MPPTAAPRGWRPARSDRQRAARLWGLVGRKWFDRAPLSVGQAISAHSNAESLQARGGNSPWARLGRKMRTHSLLWSASKSHIGQSGAASIACSNDRFRPAAVPPSLGRSDNKARISSGFKGCANASIYPVAAASWSASRSSVSFSLTPQSFSTVLNHAPSAISDRPLRGPTVCYRRNFSRNASTSSAVFMSASAAKPRAHRSSSGTSTTSISSPSSASPPPAATRSAAR